MLTRGWRRWLQLLSPSSPTVKNKPIRRQLRVEQLEDRVVPATINNLPTATPITSFGEPDASYYAQTFIAPGGDATSLTVELGPRAGAGTDDVEFRVLITEVTTTGTDLNPTNVLFESATIAHTPPASGFTQHTVNLGGLNLTAGTTYAFVLDAFVTRDSVLGASSVGGRNGYADGQFFFHFVSGGDRADHFAANWIEGSGDLAFSMTFEDQADLSVTKTDTPDPVIAGQNITYTITATNNGPNDAQNVVVTDLAPTGTTVLTATQTGGTTVFIVTPTATGFTANAATLSSGELATFELVVQTTATTPDGTVLTNTVTVDTTTVDPNLANDTDTEDTTVTNQADLSVTKTDTPDPVIAGNDLTYTITVSNTGPSDAQNVTLSDIIPANTTFVSAMQTSGPMFTLTPPPVGGTGTFTATAATFAAGATATFTLVVNVNSNVPQGGTVTNTATIASTTTDPDAANNADTEMTAVNAQADVSVPMTDSPDPVIAGNNLTYTITVSNTGPSDAQNVTLTDAVPVGTTFVSFTQNTGPTFTNMTPAVGGTGNVTSTIATLAAGATATFTFVVNVNPSTADNSIITNTATLTTTTTDATPGNNSDTETTSVTQRSVSIVDSDASVSEHVSPASPNPGQFTVTRTGDTSSALTVNYTVSGTATNGADYTTLPGSVVIPSGQSSAFIDVNVINDPNTELPESVVLTLSPDAAYVLVAPTSAFVVIADNEPEVSITASDPTAEEVGVAAVANPGQFTVTRTGDTASALTVNYTVSGTATNGTDYTTLSGTVVIPAGQASATINVTPINDNSMESSETVVVTLAAGAYTIATPTSATVTIADNETFIFAVGADGGGLVQVFDAITRAGRFVLNPFPGFLGGVRVAVGDVNGDGFQDIIAAAGPGGGAHVRVFNGINGQQLPGPLGSFFAYPNFFGGVFVASGDLNHDGFDDIVTGAGPGAGPHVKAFDGRTGAVLASFFAYTPSFAGGVTVAVGDVDGDGRADIITGVASGGAPHVKVVRATNFGLIQGDGQIAPAGLLASFFAYGQGFLSGVHVAAGDFSGDGRAEIILGTGAGSPHVKVVRGDRLGQVNAAGEISDGALLASFFAFSASAGNGVRVGVRSANGLNDVLAFTGSEVRLFSGLTFAELDRFFAFGANAGQA